MTFGTVGKISAPGQIPIEELATVLDIVHKYK
jgi:3-dehydroquinate dehydratase